MGPPGGQGEVGQQRLGLPGRQGKGGAPANPGLEAAQEGELEGCHETAGPQRTPTLALRGPRAKSVALQTFNADLDGHVTAPLYARAQRRAHMVTRQELEALRDRYPDLPWPALPPRPRDPRASR
jgi:hypothetical protein